MAEVLAEVISEDQLRERIQGIGTQLQEDFGAHRPVFVGVLMGSLPFLADLVRAVDAEADIDFLALSRFGEGGRVRIALDTTISLTGRHVVLVTNIVDTGFTLTTIGRLLETRNPASLATVVLVDKSSRRIVEVPIDYRGFEAGDEFLIGYGFDWEGRYRNLRSIWAVLDPSALAEDPDLPARRVLGAPGDRVTA
ncbi:MAG: hypoxanthine phosphoribosyltransferase [Acidimicrobiia bacterium]